MQIEWFVWAWKRMSTRGVREYTLYIFNDTRDFHQFKFILSTWKLQRLQVTRRKFGCKYFMTFTWGGLLGCVTIAEDVALMILLQAIQLGWNVWPWNQQEEQKQTFAKPRTSFQSQISRLLSSVQKFRFSWRSNFPWTIWLFTVSRWRWCDVAFHYLCFWLYDVNLSRMKSKLWLASNHFSFSLH